jgi:hypothetical protein
LSSEDEAGGLAEPPALSGNVQTASPMGRGRKEDACHKDTHHIEPADASAHSDDDELDLLSNSTADALSDDNACHSECIEAAHRVDVQDARKHENPVEGESQAVEDRTNADTFESSGCSDKQSNCGEESLEGLASEKGAEDEGSDKVVPVEENKDDKSCHSQRTEKLVKRRGKHHDVASVVQVIGPKKPPDKQMSPSAISPDRGGGCAPHDDRVESSSNRTTKMLLDAETRHLEQMEGTAGVKE